MSVFNNRLIQEKEYIRYDNRHSRTSPILRTREQASVYSIFLQFHCNIEIVSVLTISTKYIASVKKTFYFKTTPSKISIWLWYACHCTHTICRSVSAIVYIPYNNWFSLCIFVVFFFSIRFILFLARNYLRFRHLFWRLNFCPFNDTVQKIAKHSSLQSKLNYIYI